MNIAKGVLFCLGICLMGAACKSPSQKLLDDFNKVDSSLDSINTHTNDLASLTLLSLSILAMQKQNPQLATEADSIYLATTNATDFIDSIKNVLVGTDPAGENTETAMQLMDDKKTGSQLYGNLLAVYNYSVQSGSNGNGNLEDNRLQADFAATPSAAEFVQKYFRRTPTVAAATILSKFKNDCTITAIAALNNIKSRLKYK